MSENTIRSKLADNANRSVLSLTSPAKLNVISSDWLKITNHTVKSSNKIQKKRPSSSGGSVTPVSYTHLDVYKRQALQQPNYDPTVQRNDSKE